MVDIIKLTYRKLRFNRFFSLILGIQSLIFLILFQSEAWPTNSIKIGLLEEPKTMNIWLATDVWSNKVLHLIYSPLYIREPETLKLIPWLAEEEPQYDATSLSYTIKLRPAKWSDGSELTSEDVAFTGNLIIRLSLPRNLNSKLVFLFLFL